MFFVFLFSLVTALRIGTLRNVAGPSKSPPRSAHAYLYVYPCTVYFAAVDNRADYYLLSMFARPIFPVDSRPVFSDSLLPRILHFLALRVLSHAIIFHAVRTSSNLHLFFAVYPARCVQRPKWIE